MNNSPFDLRSTLFREHFEKGLAYPDYVQTGDAAQQKRWNGYEELISLAESESKLIHTFTRQMNVLVLSGIWCGDCMRQGPMFRVIENASPLLKFRYVDNNQNPALRDELRVAGGARVPVVVILSEDYFEVARSGDRTLSAYRRKAAQELGPACDAGLVAPDPEELALEVAEWVAYFERAQLLLRLSPFLRKRHND